MRPVVVIFAKSARMGRAKTRLARDIGHSQAMRWSRYCLRRACCASRRWQAQLCVTPDADVGSAAWPRGWRVSAQGNGDLGTRLCRALRACPPGPVLLIGADAPAITASLLDRAFASLRSGRRAVFGPAVDGGFWVMGISAGLRRRGVAFAPVRWSTSCALQDMQSLLPEGTPVHYLPTLIDLDDGASVRSYLLTRQSRAYLLTRQSRTYRL